MVHSRQPAGCHAARRDSELPAKRSPFDRLRASLNSTALTTDAAGTVTSEMRYTAWGEVRYASGTAASEYTFNGQYTHVDDFGLVYFKARWLDAALGIL